MKPQPEIWLSGAKHRARMRAPAGLLKLEKNKIPFVLTIGSSIILAGMTALRFVLMIGLLSPDQYGVLNLITVAVNLIPMLAILGLPLHLQKMVRSNGTDYIKVGVKKGFLAVGFTLIPTFILLLALIYPFVKTWTECVVYAVCTVVICHSSGISIFTSQMILGAGYRGLASIIMLASNSVLTLTILVPHILDISSLQFILICWASGSVVCMAGATALGLWLSGRSGPDSRVNSIISSAVIDKRIYIIGIATIPSMVGPWLLVFAIRYMLGLNLGANVVAAYAIASTIIDTAFLVSAAVVAFASNRIIDGVTSPLRPFLIAASFMTGLALVATVAVPFVLETFGQQGYELSNLLVLVLYVGGVFRLQITAWRQKALAVGGLGGLSTAFLISTGLAILVLWVWHPDDAMIYAYVQAFSYGAVSLGQVLWIAYLSRKTQILAHVQLP